MCDYKGCKRPTVSGGNCICDVAGDVTNVDLCAFHLRKLVPDAVLEDKY